MIPFHPLFRNPHLQTIASHFWRRPRALQPVERRIIETEPGVCVLVESQRPEAAAGEIVMVHGLEGSGEAGYIESLAAAALRAGYAVAPLPHAHLRRHRAPFAHPVPRRIDRRSGRGAARLPPGRPRAGVRRGLLAGRKRGAEAGRRTRAIRPRNSCAASAACRRRSIWSACARRIAAPDNRLYERRFVRKMRRRLLSTGRYAGGRSRRPGFD